jgi:hypothetical protein
MRLSTARQDGCQLLGGNTTANLEEQFSNWGSMASDIDDFINQM